MMQHFPRFMVERTISGLSKMSNDEVLAIHQAACRGYKRLDEGLVWISTVVAGDKMYCLVIAKDTEVVIKHAEISELPIDSITEVRRIELPEPVIPPRAQSVNTT